jgi:cyclin L
MNPFVNSRPSLSQIESTPSSQDGISAELEDLLRSYGTKLIQSCGILLKLYLLSVLRSHFRPQSTIATAMVLFQQFYYVASLRQHALKVFSRVVSVNSRTR